MPSDEVLFDVRFPNESQGTMQLTVPELFYMIEQGEVSLKFQRIRSVTIPILAQYYSQTTTYSQTTKSEE